jgi:hypothetical protein
VEDGQLNIAINFQAVCVRSGDRSPCSSCNCHCMQDRVQGRAGGGQSAHKRGSPEARGGNGGRSPDRTDTHQPQKQVSRCCLPPMLTVCNVTCAEMDQNFVRLFVLKIAQQSRFPDTRLWPTLSWCMSLASMSCWLASVY